MIRPSVPVAAALVAATALIAAVAPSARAQAAGQAQNPAPAAPAADGRVAVHANMAGQYRTISLMLTRAAEAMPEEHYGFRPTPEMRPFLANIVHAAASNYGYCANLRRTKPAVDPSTLASTVTTKAQAIKALADSAAFCTEFVTALTAPGFFETYQATRRGPDGATSPIQVEVGGLFSNLIAHQNEVYGYTAVYLRLKGIVPPSSAGRPARGGGGAH